MGFAVTEAGNPIHFGLGVGTPDLIGWKTVTVTPEMVGQPFAVFVGIEVKRPGEVPTPEQAGFLALLEERGAVSGVASSLEEAARVLGMSTPEAAVLRKRSIRRYG